MLPLHPEKTQGLISFRHQSERFEFLHERLGNIWYDVAIGFADCFRHFQSGDS